MNRKPISYLQTDVKWKDLTYKGMTLGAGGCGPTASAMLIATLKDPNVTPAITYDWAGKNGFLSPGHGTEYGNYFQTQFAQYGIDCKMLNWKKSYGNPNHSNHALMLDLLKQGYYVIALMGPGLWTTTGHFVVVWWADEKIRINDPASTKITRLNGDPKTFFSQVSYYWIIDAREYNKPREEEEELTQEKFNEMFYEAMKKYRGDFRDNDSSEWSEKAREWAIEKGLFSGNESKNFMWEDFLTREQAAVLFYNFAKLNGWI